MFGNGWETGCRGMPNPWAPSTGTTNAAYGSDWMYGTNPASSQGGENFPAALLRGGLWADGADAGVFALSADFAPSGSDFSIGFRCAR